MLARELPAETLQALATLHDLTGGIYPPLLAEQGMGAALRSHAHSMPIHVDVLDRGLRRAGRPAEQAAYFCCLEALQNASKHSRARQVILKLETAGRELRIEILETAQCQLPEISYREALGGAAGEMVWLLPSLRRSWPDLPAAAQAAA